VEMEAKVVCVGGGDVGRPYVTSSECDFAGTYG